MEAKKNSVNIVVTMDLHITIKESNLEITHTMCLTKMHNMSIKFKVLSTAEVKMVQE